MTDHSQDQLTKLKAEKSKIEGYFTVATIGFVIAFFVIIGFYNTTNRQSKMIDNCISEISGLNSTITDASNDISSMNSDLDSISSDASYAAGSDYDTQASTLDDISSKASSAQTSQDISAPDTTCIQSHGSGD